MLLPGPKRYLQLKDIISAEIGWNAICRQLTHMKICLKRQIVTEACGSIELLASIPTLETSLSEQNKSLESSRQCSRRTKTYDNQTGEIQQNKRTTNRE